jgi:deoxycytidine triphosphate deaminase
VIFTDREIQIALSKSQIVIKPEPKLEAYSSTSVDLRLADRVTVFKETLNTGAVETIIDPDPRKEFVAEDYKMSLLVDILDRPVKGAPI